MSYPYIAFISYRHLPLDMAVAKKIHRLIEHYRIPKDLNNDAKRLGRVFRDQDELAASEDLSADIRKALDLSEYLIVVCTKQTRKSKWVLEEIRYFLEHHGRNKVLTILAEGTPETSFPEILTQVQYDNGSYTSIEPLAADIVSRSISGSLRKLNSESLRIFAALLNCSYDSLRQRERIYRQKRILLFVAVFFAVAMVFSGILLKKNHEIVLKNKEISLKNEELLEKDAQITQQNTELQVYSAEIENQAAELLKNSQELSRQNTRLKNYAEEIEQQNIQLQVSNTESLIQTAEVLFENGNYAGAVEAAANAVGFANDIPDSNKSSVLLPQAEAVFAEASGLFDWYSAPLRQTQTIEIDAQNFAVQFINHKKVALLSPFGTLEMYDTETGERIWTQNMQGHYNSDYISTVADDRVRLYSAKDGLIIAKYEEQLSAYTEDGACQWTIYASDLNYDNSIVISDDGSLIAYIDSFDYNYPRREYVLSVFETLTGQAVGHYALDEDNGDEFWPDFWFWSSYKPYNTHVINGRSDANDHAPQIGVFSEDNRYFYFAADVAYVAERTLVDEEDRHFVYYKVDLKNPDKGDVVVLDAVTVIEAEEIGGSKGRIIALDEIDGDLIAYHFDGIVENNAVVEDTSVTMERIRFADEAIVWKNAGEWMENPKGWYNHACYYRYDDCIYAALNGTIYAFDPSSGEKKLAWKLADGEITSLYPVGDDFLQVTLDIGLVLLDWREPSVWQNDIDNHIMYKIPKHVGVTASGSLLKPIVSTFNHESSYVRELINACADIDNRMALTNENHDGIVLLSFVEFVEGANELLDVPENYYCSTLEPMDAAVADNGDSCVFFFQNYDDEEQHLWVEVGRDTSIETERALFSLPEDQYTYDSAFVPQNQSILLQPDITQPYLRKIMLRTGESKILFDQKKALQNGNVPADEYEYLNLTVSSAYSRNNGAVLTAACDGKQLQWWKNAKLAGSIVVPEEMRSYDFDVDHNGMLVPVECYSVTWPFYMGGSGLIIMVKADMQEFPYVFQSGLAYDTNTDTWYELDAGIFEQDDLLRTPEVYIAEQDLKFATVNNDGSICVYDVEKNQRVTAIETGFRGTISKVRFIANDEYLLLYSTLGVSEIYCIKTGERVLRLDALISDVTIDDSGDRVYLMKATSGAYCYDVDSWSFIKYIPDAVHFDAERSKMYYFAPHGKMYVKHIPSRQELY